MSDCRVPLPRALHWMGLATAIFLFEASAYGQGDFTFAVAQPWTGERVDVFVAALSGVGCQGMTSNEFSQLLEPRLLMHMNVLEREHLNRIFEEQKLGMTGVLKESEVIEAGKLSGAEAIVICQADCISGKSMLSCKLVSCESGQQWWNATGFGVGFPEFVSALQQGLTTGETVQSSPSVQQKANNKRKKNKDWSVVTPGDSGPKIGLQLTQSWSELGVTEGVLSVSNAVGQSGIRIGVYGHLGLGPGRYSSSSATDLSQALTFDEAINRGDSYIETVSVLGYTQVGGGALVGIGRPGASIRWVFQFGIERGSEGDLYELFQEPSGAEYLVSSSIEGSSVENIRGMINAEVGSFWLGAGYTTGTFSGPIAGIGFHITKTAWDEFWEH